MSDQPEVIEPVATPVIPASAEVAPVVDAVEPAAEVAAEVVAEVAAEVVAEVEEELPPPMERVGVGSLIERTPRGWMAHLMYGGARRIHGEGATIEDAVKAALGVTA